MKRISSEEYFRLMDEIHQGVYTYPDRTMYTGIKTQIRVVCKVHGEFEIRADNHRYRMSGCRKCSNSDNWVERCLRKNNKVARLYLAKFYSEDEAFIKIGKTCYDAAQQRCERVVQECLAKYDHKYEFEILVYIVGDPHFISKAESELIKDMTEFKYTPYFKFGGYTECVTFKAVFSDKFIDNWEDKLTKASVNKQQGY